MISSKDVFQKRRDGDLDAAYALALERMAATDRDAWDVRALGWCLVDLVKKFAGDRPSPELERYAAELNDLIVPPDDEVLTKQRDYALSLLQAGATELQEAKRLSKAGKFREAVGIYAVLFNGGTLDRSNHTNYGWDLFKATRDALQQEPQDQWSGSPVAEARRYLGIYLKLDVERPSLLHSCILQQALRLAPSGHLKVMAFVRMWGLEHLRAEDFERYVAEDGKARSSLAETAVQHAAKEAVLDGQAGNLEYVQPFVDLAMARFPDNAWLRLNKAKILRALGRQDEALAVAIDFAKSKVGEYWAWELLGDLVTDPEQRRGCYCKALICSQDDNFVSGVRLKLARALVGAGEFPEAKGEVLRVIEHKTRAGHRIPAEAHDLMQGSWFSEVSALEPKAAFYARFASQADDLLLSAVPWIDACVGESFTIEGQESKPRRKLYLQGTPFPTEVSVHASKLRLKNLAVGLPIKVKAELEPGEGRRFTLYAAALREDGSDFDIFPETIGVIDSINADKGLLHFMAGVDAHGTFSLAEYSGTASLGGSVAIRLATYHSKRGAFLRALTVGPSAEPAGPNVCRSFKDKVRVDKGMGFTPDGVFIPPDLVSAHGLGDEDFVSGTAVLSHNKKRQTWGWKAILIE
ncbi:MULTISPECIES: hypothetical protein [unclassified Brevundimonas]|uniref:DUF7017 domain-containing protein n=1 Tax=unclassified Brevundimonas TaxID=2622653 RepID=UPI0006F2B7BB|nr:MULTISPECIES: hypothetical protein [unclassified Brevundimonas]KQY95034.1 hypothetical protein ASD25_17090 [Brevundimonas sp. Root1423]KRA28520.1 hypothetical protein ASD59_01430 [Brevundimonas sp. Root608]